MKSSLKVSLALIRLRAFPYIDCTILTNHSSTPSFLKAYHSTFLGIRSKAFSKFATCNEGSPAQKKYCDSIEKPKLISFATDSNKKNLTVSEEENKSFNEILSCYDNRALNLRYIMHWPVTKNLIQYAQMTARLRKQTGNPSFATNYKNLL